MEEIGEVKHIFRYPVKSMTGEEVNAIYVHENGLNGDRIFALYEPESRRHSLPYCTGRENSRLLLIKPRIINEQNMMEEWPQGFKPQVVVKLEDLANEVDINDPAFLESMKSLSGRELVLDYRRAGLHDSKAVSIMGLRSVQQIGAESENKDLDFRRFRENIYADFAEPFYEDKLVGKSIQLGEAVVHVAKRNERCPVICLNPDSAAYDKRVLAVVARNHEKNAGVLAIVRKQGIVRQGDKISLA